MFWTPLVSYRFRSRIILWLEKAMKSSLKYCRSQHLKIQFIPDTLQHCSGQLYRTDETQSSMRLLRLYICTRSVYSTHLILKLFDFWNFDLVHSYQFYAFELRRNWLCLEELYTKCLSICRIYFACTFWLCS